MTDNYEIRFIKKLVHDSALTQLDLGITHTPSNPQFSPSSLDTIIIDSPSKVITVNVSPAPIAASHHALFLEYSIDTLKPSREYRFRTFKKFNTSSANAYLSNLISQLPPLDIHTNLELYLQTFYSTLKTTLDKFAPFVALKKRSISPWLDTHTKALMKTRDKLTAQYNKYHNPSTLERLKFVRKEIKKNCRRLKCSSIYSSLSQSLDSSSMWSSLNRMGLTRRKDNSAVSYFPINELNLHYQTVASLHPPCSLDSLNHLCKTQCKNNTSFQFSTVSTELVRTKLLKKIKKNNSISPDGLPIKYLDKLLDSIIPTLTQYYNHCILRSFYPKACKLAYIIPLKKKLSQ